MCLRYKSFKTSLFFVCVSKRQRHQLTGTGSKNRAGSSQEHLTSLFFSLRLSHTHTHTYIHQKRHHSHWIRRANTQFCFWCCCCSNYFRPWRRISIISLCEEYKLKHTNTHFITARLVSLSGSMINMNRSLAMNMNSYNSLMAHSVCAIRSDVKRKKNDSQQLWVQGWTS